MLAPRLHVFLLLSLCPALSPATSRPNHLPSLADQRCPCKEARNCEMKFAKMNPAAHFAVLQFIPSCPSFQGRCCTAEMMLLTIIELSQSPSPPPLLHPRQNNNHAVTCVPVKDCPVNNIYGTNSLHFEQFGFISPSESDCQATQDNILCIVPARTLDTKPRTGELPCVLPSSCSEVYGEDASHFADHGLQFACPNDDEVRCLDTKTSLAATISTTTPLTPTASELPCLSPSSCSEVYGTLGSHFTDYGLQYKCRRSEDVRCVVAAQPTTTIRTTTSTTSTQATTAPSPTTSELPCLQPSACAEVYGTAGSHFNTYGLQFRCERSDEVRCVVTSSTARPVTIRQTTTRQTTTKPQDQEPSTAELPCLHPSICAEVYGTVGSHFTTYGLQFGCPRNDEVRCVVTSNKETTRQTTTRRTTTKRTTTRRTTTRQTTTKPTTTRRTTTRRTTTSTTPTQATKELPCLHPSSCVEVYGTLGSHFTAYGLQFRCPQSIQVRCVSSVSNTTSPITTRPTTPRPSTTRRTTRRPTTTIHPLFTTHAPVTAPPPSVVNIVGPSPIYIGLNDNQGPAFHQVGSSQHLSIHTDKKEQIRNLLELLDKRLKQIMKKYPKQD